MSRNRRRERKSTERSRLAIRRLEDSAPLSRAAVDAFLRSHRVPIVEAPGAREAGYPRATLDFRPKQE